MKQQEKKIIKASACKGQVPIELGVLALPEKPGETAHLIGSRCKRCGEYFSPKQEICSKCSNESMEEVLLSTRGRVWGATIMHYPPALYKGPLPFAAGRVELSEGAIVPTLFTDCDLEKPLDIGTEVEMITEKFGEDEDGNEIITYKFRPVI